MFFSVYIHLGVRLKPQRVLGSVLQCSTLRGSFSLRNPQLHKSQHLCTASLRRSRLSARDLQFCFFQGVWKMAQGWTDTISLPFDFTACMSMWKYPCPVVLFCATYQHKEERNCARLPRSFSSLNSTFKSSSVLREIKIHSLFLFDFGQMFEPRTNLLQQTFAKSQPIHCFTIPKATCQIYDTFASYRKKHNYMPIPLCINFSMQQNLFLQPASAAAATPCIQQKPGLLIEVAPFYTLVLLILCTICYQKPLHSLKLCLRRRKKSRSNSLHQSELVGDFNLCLTSTSQVTVLEI